MIAATVGAVALGFLSPVTVDATPSTTTLDRAPLAAQIGQRDVSFLAIDLESDARCVLEGSDLDSRHAPWSTFKIPNLLIALETGIAADLSAARAWNQTRRPPQNYWPDAWRQDHTLETAFQKSAVWYFRDLALDVGTDTYRTFLDAWSYGNAEVVQGADDFWLNLGLEISAEEQVAFLRALLTGRLGVSSAAIAALTEASAAEASGGLTLHGKTGAGTVERGNFDGDFEGWYVGWVDRPDRAPAVFALYARADSFAAIRDFRKAFAAELLTRCDLLPDGFGS